jgi:TolB-like protein
MPHGIARAGELDGRMAKIVKTFSRAAAEAGVSTATLAVLPFKTDKKLAEKRVDYACAEILTNRFIEAKTFKVTERARLEELMQEQRLGLSGAVESATAAKVGKLAGARLVILGSVARLGANYHLSTEMVDSETGEIMASDVTEVAVETFDKDASRYITEVPEYDAIGLYLAGGIGLAGSKKVSPVTNPNSGTPVTLTPVNRDISYYGSLGVGLRYLFSPKWMADAAYFPSVVFGGGNGTIATGLHPANTAPMTNVNNPESYETTMFRLLLAHTLPVSRVFSAQAAVGFTQFPQFQADAVYVDNAGGSTPVTIRTSNSRTSLTTFRLGAEWKPRPRFGWSVSALFYLGKMTARTTATFPDRGTAVIQKYETQPFAVETNLAVYF